MRPEKRRDAPRLHVRDQGCGAQAVLLHGSAGSGAQWRALAGRLAARFRVRAPDLLGYGASPARDPAAPPTLTDHALLVARLLDAAPGPLHLVGHSFGGAVALRLALLLGARVRSLTLIEPVAFQLLRDRPSGDAAAFAGARALAGDMARDLDRGHGAAAMRRFVDFWSGPGAWDGLDTGRRAALAARAGEVLGDFHAIEREPSRLDALARLRAPTLVLHGGRSPLPAVITARRVAAAIPGAQRIRVRDAGHMAPLTHPEVVSLLLCAHLECAEERARRPRARAAQPVPPQAATAPWPLLAAAATR